MNQPITLEIQMPGTNTTSTNLRDRKQQWMRRMIMEAAMKLFIANGFEATTADQIAEAAGVSVRSFFRYFGNKEEIFGQEIVAYGEVLSAAIAACPKSYSPMQTLEHTVMHLATLAEQEPMTRAVLQVMEKSPGARQAQSARIPEAREKVTQAYAKKLKFKRSEDASAEVLGALTFTVVEVAVRSWYRGGHTDIHSAVQQTLRTMTKLVVSAAD